MFYSWAGFLRSPSFVACDFEGRSALGVSTGLYRERRLALLRRSGLRVMGILAPISTEIETS